MVAISLPTTSMPGQYKQESGGRIINGFIESLGETAASKFVLRRAPGMLEFGTTAQETFRGGIEVNGLAYSAWEGRVETHSAIGGAGTILTGSLSGDDGVFWMRNNKTPTADVVVVSPSNGAFEVSTSAVVAYTDSDVGAPSSGCFIKGYFIFGYGSGKMQASGLNATTIDTLDSATAESKADTLYRVVARGDTLIAAGSESIEFWAINGEATGFPFSPVSTHERGIIGRYAIGGHEAGFGYGIFFVADDFSVRQIDGYSSTKISPPDLDRLIEAVEDKTTIQVSVYISQGHPFVVVQCTDWTWEYDVTLQRWHERQSYNRTRWKGSFPFKAFDKWLCGNIADDSNARLFTIDALTRTEDDEPLLCDIETGPMGDFDSWISVDGLSLLCSVGVGNAPGTDPIETDPSILIYISKDNGLSWSNPWVRKLGAQGQGLQRVTVNDMGHCGPHGAKFKFRVSDPVHVGIMSGDVKVTELGN